MSSLTPLVSIRLIGVILIIKLLTFNTLNIMKQIVIFSYSEVNGKFTRDLFAVVYPSPDTISIDVLAEKLIKGFPDGTCYEVLDTPTPNQH